MVEFHLLTNVAGALAFALVGGLAARLLRLPVIAGYLLAGAAISPFTPGYDADIETIRELAELGVIFLMFGVGMHFNIRDLLSVKGIAGPGALVQISAATAMGLGAAAMFGLPWREGLVLGLAISIASTVVLVRALEERGLMESIHGRVAIGWLVVEDLATVLFLVLLPTLAPDSNGDALQDTAIAVAKAGAFLAILLIPGARFVPWVLGVVARTGSRELFILAVVVAALGIATGGALFGVSVALGAFIAGVVISETETSHQAAADVLPLREAFAVLFFVSVGMLLDPGVLIDNAGLLAVVLAIILAGKGIVALVVTAPFHYPARTGLTVAAGLAQVGEFSFIIAQEGLDHDLVTPGTYNVILAAAVISIALNPLAFAGTRRIELLLDRKNGRLWRLLDHQGDGPPVEIPQAEGGHVILAGFGRVGHLIGNALARLEIPILVIEADIGASRRLHAAGTNVVWGDAASVEVLEMAGIEKARLLVIAVPDESTAMLAMANAHRVNPGLQIIVRARTGEELPVFYQMGAHEVVVPEYEGGLELMRQTLDALGYDTEETLAYSRAVRDIHYGDTARTGGHVDGPGERD
ncbi:MAG: cation:proton antiporter [Tepidiformaceae bacterium]